MLAQLKTVVLIKAIKLAFLRRVEYLERQHLCVRFSGSKWPEAKNFLLKLVSLFLFLEMAASLNSTLKTPISMSTVKR
jgi:hypothetical protein